MPWIKLGCCKWRIRIVSVVGSHLSCPKTSEKSLSGYVQSGTFPRRKNCGKNDRLYRISVALLHGFCLFDWRLGTTKTFILGCKRVIVRLVVTQDSFMPVGDSGSKAAVTQLCGDVRCISKLRWMARKSTFFNAFFLVIYEPGWWCTMLLDSSCGIRNSNCLITAKTCK